MTQETIDAQVKSAAAQIEAAEQALAIAKEQLKSAEENKLREALVAAFAAAPQLQRLEFELEFDGDFQLCVYAYDTSGRAMYPQPTDASGGVSGATYADGKSLFDDIMLDGPDDGIVYDETPEYMQALACIAQSGVLETIDEHGKLKEYDLRHMFPNAGWTFYRAGNSNKVVPAGSFTLTREDVEAKNFDPQTFGPKK